MDCSPDHAPAKVSCLRFLTGQWMFYAGPSMNPTFRASDILHIVPYDGRTIRCGDVILFIHPDGGQAIVHRVVSSDAQGVLTRGDNNNLVDPYVVEPSWILGRIVSAHRGKESRRIYGGLAGRAIGRIMNVRSFIDRRLYARPATPGSGLLKKLGAWLLSLMPTRIVRFGSMRGSELQIHLGRHLIGRLPAGGKRWVIRRPFRPFVDDAALPTNDTP